MPDCLFCNYKSLNPVKDWSQFVVIKDRFPVTEGHLLLIPKAHRLDFFELTQEEKMELLDLLDKLKIEIQVADPEVTGFNIGMNCGASAGQTVFHCHVHLIPRRDGDAADPTGGVRGVIADRQKY